MGLVAVAGFFGCSDVLDQPIDPSVEMMTSSEVATRFIATGRYGCDVDYQPTVSSSPPPHIGDVIIELIGGIDTLNPSANVYMVLSDSSHAEVSMWNTRTFEVKEPEVMNGSIRYLRFVAHGDIIPLIAPENMGEFEDGGDVFAIEISQNPTTCSSSSAAFVNTTVDADVLTIDERFWHTANPENWGLINDGTFTGAYNLSLAYGEESRSFGPFQCREDLIFYRKVAFECPGGL